MASSGENKDGSSSSTQRRYPNSMEGVLQMAIANTPTEEAAGGDSQRTEPTPLDPEVTNLYVHGCSCRFHQTLPNLGLILGVKTSPSLAL